MLYSLVCGAYMNPSTSVHGASTTMQRILSSGAAMRAALLAPRSSHQRTPAAAEMIYKSRAFDSVHSIPWSRAP
eukprot:1155890-Amphidinium_carterae.2